MEGYPMPIADMLVDAAAEHKVISFMDGNAGYNQIFMAEEDIAKTTFRCAGAIGLFEWVVMTFGLKNASARETLECMRKHGLKMNPNKCAFGVSVVKFLGFMVHERGIEIGQKV